MVPGCCISRAVTSCDGNQAHKTMTILRKPPIGRQYSCAIIDQLLTVFPFPSLRESAGRRGIAAIDIIPKKHRIFACKKSESR